jgi:predicted AlkP superfamily pyrophosphatase or phosphodiesterase
MPLPDYRTNSIVNLMSSILAALGGNPRGDAPLSSLPAAELNRAYNVVLLVIDGLGYEYLLTRAVSSIFHEHLRGYITSVFPPTTATAITSFITGVAPREHAITGWFMHLKELGTVAAILPFKPRYGGAPFSHLGIVGAKIFDQPSIFEKIQIPTYAIMPQWIINSAFNRTMLGRTNRLAYQDLTGCISCLNEALFAKPERKFIFAYWPQLDSLAHQYGMGSLQVATHFAELDEALRRFLVSIQKPRTVVLITADHGLIDTQPARTIRLENHPDLAETLILPLCGEPRMAYCYIHPAKTEQFEAYVTEHLSDYCTWHRSEHLLEMGYFGLHNLHPQLIQRIGNYALIMRENYIIKDSVLGETKFDPIGVHGGLSREEMYVPFCVVET